MKINWKVRVKNKLFWLALIPAVLLVVQVVAEPLGYTIPIDVIGEKLIVAVNAVFALLVVLGVVVDPTVDGLDDSRQALQYDEPKKDVYKGMK